MARIGERGPATSGEVLNQLKDQYANREREMETRHRDEMREIKDAHRAELEEVKEEAAKTVHEQQDENNVKLNQRDLQYQKEIEALKALYTRRMTDGKKT